MQWKKLQSAKELPQVKATTEGLFHFIIMDSSGQIALAWLHAQGDFVIPIPGTSTISHLDNNIDALDVTLTEAELDEINQICDPSKVSGDRYAHAALTFHGHK